MKLTLSLPSLSATKRRFAISNDVRIANGEQLPGSWLPILRDALNREAELFRWGLSEAIMGGDDRLVYAIKIEDLASRKNRHLLSRRVIVPVQGFSVSCDGKAYRVRSSDTGPMALAGVWDVGGHWRGRPVHAFRIISGPSLEGFEALGPRMPVVLQSTNERAWLWHFTEDDEALDALEPETNLEFEKI